MILGISPGTRTCGFAIIRDGQVRKCGVQTYKESWSDGKLIGILYNVSKLLHRHRIQRVAVKIPDTMPRSMGFTQLIGALNALLEQREIKVRYYTLSDLAKRYEPGNKPDSTL